jgi:hypothetical protein
MSPGGGQEAAGRGPGCRHSSFASKGLLPPAAPAGLLCSSLPSYGVVRIHRPAAHTASHHEWVGRRASGALATGLLSVICIVQYLLYSTLYTGTTQVQYCMCRIFRTPVLLQLPTGLLFPPPPLPTNERLRGRSKRSIDPASPRGVALLLIHNRQDTP